MGKRDSLTKKSYAVRNKKGQIKDVVNKGKSNKQDRLTQTGEENIPKTKGGKAKSGYGHLGDYEKTKRGKWSLFDVM